MEAIAFAKWLLVHAEISVMGFFKFKHNSPHKEGNFWVKTAEEMYAVYKKETDNGTDYRQDNNQSKHR